MNKSIDAAKAALIADIKAKAFDEIADIYLKYSQGKIGDRLYHQTIDKINIEVQAKIQELN